MKLFDYPAENAPAYNKGCCTLDDVEDARRVCQILDVPHYVFNLQREFRAHVIDYFLAEYQRGKTPIPASPATTASSSPSFSSAPASSARPTSPPATTPASFPATKDGGC